MKDPNENRPRYRQTKIGWLPEDWKVFKVNEVGAVQAGRQRSPHFVKGELRSYLRVANIFDGYIDTSDVLRMLFTKEDFERYRLQDGDILLNEGQSLELVGRCAKYLGMPRDCCFQNTLIRFRANELITPDFAQILFSYLQKNGVFTKIASQTTSIAHLGVSRFANLHIPVPTIFEQKKIAKILHSWDTTIDQTRKQIEAKKKRKKALMQQLYEGNMHLENLENEKWVTSPLGALVSPVSRPIPKPSQPYIALGLRSHGKGTFHRLVEDTKKIEMDTLYRIEQGDIIVNITFAWEGAIAVADKTDEGSLVSHRFPTYRVRENSELSFLRQLIVTSKFVWDLGIISPGGAGRNRVLNKKDFLKLKVLTPPKATQRKIGEILSSADKEIELLEGKLTTLEKQKHGLMQKLLTGEVRVRT